jgi:hypothetical protein
MISGEGLLLRVFVGESDRHSGKPLYEFLVSESKKHGIAGATVLRGLMGYGAHGSVHTAKILDISTNLPLVIEFMDTAERIESFLPIVDEHVKEGLATLEKIQMRWYRKEQK